MPYWLFSFTSFPLEPSFPLPLSLPSLPNLNTQHLTHCHGNTAKIYLPPWRCNPDPGTYSPLKLSRLGLRIQQECSFSRPIDSLLIWEKLLDFISFYNRKRECEKNFQSQIRLYSLSSWKKTDQEVFSYFRSTITLPEASCTRGFNFKVYFYLFQNESIMDWEVLPKPKRNFWVSKSAKMFLFLSICIQCLQNVRIRSNDVASLSIKCRHQKRRIWCWF